VVRSRRADRISKRAYRFGSWLKYDRDGSSLGRRREVVSSDEILERERFWLEEFIIEASKEARFDLGWRHLVGGGVVLKNERRQKIR